MKKLTFFAAATVPLLLTGTAIAQSFTSDVVWEPVETIGGMTGADGSRSGGGGIVDGSYTTTYEDGSVSEGKVRCVGMDQPDNGLFDLHLSCSTSDGTGTASLVYGCNYLGEPGPDTPLGCVGGIEGMTGDAAERRGSLTMEWYSDTEARGTGQWYGSE